MSVSSATGLPSPRDSKTEIELVRAIDRLKEQFYHDLDGLVPDGVYSKEWLELVNEVIEPYEDWILEVWEYDQ